MPTGIGIIHRIVTAIRIKVIRQQITVSAEVRCIVRGDETAYRRVIVAGFQIVQRGFFIVVVTAVANGVFVGNADRGVIVRNCASTPCIIVVSGDSCAVGIVNAEDIALEVLAKVVRGLRVASIVSETEDTAGCIIVGFFA